jgi:hypothetical protein
VLGPSACTHWRRADEAVLPGHEATLKHGQPKFSQSIKGRLVMWALVENLYRDFCLSRLNEFRRLDQHA